MTIRVLFFAIARERSGEAASTLAIEADLSVAKLRQLLVACYPSIASIASATKVAVNQEFVGDDYVLHDGDEVALIPPVSGGS